MLGHACADHSMARPQTRGTSEGKRPCRRILVTFRQWMKPVCTCVEAVRCGLPLPACMRSILLTDRVTHRGIPALNVVAAARRREALPQVAELAPPEFDFLPQLRHLHAQPRLLGHRRRQSGLQQRNATLHTTERCLRSQPPALKIFFIMFLLCSN
jgi:hypothetical protein